MAELHELEEKRDGLMADMKALVDRSSGDALSTGDQQRFNNLETAVKRLNADISQARADRAAWEASIHEGLANGTMRFDGDDFAGKGVQTMRRTNPGWGSLESASRDSGLAAIEQSARSIPEDVPDQVLETVTEILEAEARTPLAERNGLAGEMSPAAEWARVTSDPSYVSAMREYMRDPLGARDTWSPEERAAVRRTRQWQQARAMNEGSTAAGGAAVPFFLDGSIVLTNAGTISPIRNLATVKRITTSAWHGVTSAGVNGEWIAEATQVADASPTFVQPAIPVFKADSYVQGSMELLGDAALSGEIAMLLAEAKERLEATAFVSGNGVTQPKGLITALSGAGPSLAGSSGAAGAADLVAADIYALQQGLNPRWRSEGATFLASLPVINKIRQLNTGTGAYQSTFWAEFGEAVPPKLIGSPIYEVGDMDTTIVSGSNDDVLLFGSLRNYFIIDRLGMEIAYNPIVVGANQRPTGESGWVSFWRVGADVVSSSSFRLLRL